jgi:serine acetyltransferase
MHAISVGAGALIGIGSNVIRPVAPAARVAGNPARMLQ